MMRESRCDVFNGHPYWYGIQEVISNFPPSSSKPVHHHCNHCYGTILARELVLSAQKTMTHGVSLVSFGGQCWWTLRFLGSKIASVTVGVCVMNSHRSFNNSCGMESVRLAKFVSDPLWQISVDCLNDYRSKPMSMWQKIFFERVPGAPLGAPARRSKKSWKSQDQSWHLDD